MGLESTNGLVPGQIVWVSFSPTIGREQAGDSPAIIVSSSEALEIVTELVTVCPITTKSTGWGSHIPVTIGKNSSWIMSEQVKSISVRRILRATDIIASQRTLEQFKEAHTELVIH